MLGHELVAVGEVVRAVSANVLRSGHQEVDEVVHHKRDLDVVHGLKPHPLIIRSHPGAGGVGHDASLPPPNELAAAHQEQLGGGRSPMYGYATTLGHPMT